MILAVHQPIFMPWPGFFFKALSADCLVLLDDVQFPRGRGWVNRNRLKNGDGELWLTVPVLKRGRGLQIIRRVEIQDDKPWRNKHLESIRHNYVNAPYFSDYYPAIENVYQTNHTLLADLNTDLIEFFLGALSIETRLLRQSELGASGTGTELIAEVCDLAGARQLLTFPMVEKHLEMDLLAQRGIEIVYANFRPPVYPQLWGEFVYNLSTLDLLLNCGSKSRDVLAGPTRRSN